MIWEHKGQWHDAQFVSGSIDLFKNVISTYIKKKKNSELKHICSPNPSQVIVMHDNHKTVKYITVNARKLQQQWRPT